MALSQPKRLCLNVYVGMEAQLQLFTQSRFICGVWFGSLLQFRSLQEYPASVEELLAI